MQNAGDSGGPGPTLLATSELLQRAKGGDKACSPPRRW